MNHAQIDDKSLQKYLAELRQLIDLTYSNEELIALCFDLGIDHEHLPGQEKLSKIHNFLLYIIRRNRLGELIELCRQQRPDTIWPDVPSAIEWRERFKEDSIDDLAPFRPPPNSANPYRGLQAFREEDEPYFFGRESFSERLFCAVSSQQIAVVVGSSGSGKSSVVFAGLVPRLKKSGPWLVTSFRPGENPFLSLAISLLILLEPDSTESDRLRKAGEQVLAWQAGILAPQDVVGRILDKNIGNRILLVVDQFEQLYTLCESDEIRNAFLDALFNKIARSAAGKALTICLTLRADFVDHVLKSPLLVQIMQDRDHKLGPMTREELRQTIVGPIGELEVQFQPGLVERILDEVGDEPGHLLLLEFTLTQLWQNRELTHRAYEAMGKVSGALKQHLDNFYKSLEEEERTRLRSVLLQLVQPSNAGRHTRRIVKRTDLDSSSWRVIQQLVDAHIVVTDREDAVETVELVHEALISTWGTLRLWVEEAQECLLFYDRLNRAAAEWDDNGRQSDYLYRGKQFSQAITRIAEYEYLQPSKLTQEFIHACVQESKKIRFGPSLLWEIIGGGIGIGVAAYLYLSIVTANNEIFVITLTPIAVLLGILFGILYGPIFDVLIKQFDRALLLLSAFIGATLFLLLRLMFSFHQLSSLPPNGISTLLIAGGLWGLVAGMGRAWLLHINNFTWRNCLLISVLCGISLWLFDTIFQQNIAASPILSFLTGAAVPFFILSGNGLVKQKS